MMDGWLLLLPVAIPALCALAMVSIAARPAAQQAVALVGGIALAAVAAALIVATADGTILTLRFGGWDPRLGIVWACDGLSATMVALAAIASLASVVAMPGSLTEAESPYARPLHQAMLIGVLAAFLTGDLFNLFVAFELMLLASFALLAIGGGAERTRRAVPYVAVNLVASALLLAGVGAVYGTAGTVNLAELSLRAIAGLPPACWAAVALVLAVFAVKAALAPVFIWLPDAYPAAPPAIAALFSGLLTKVGVYALFRVVPLLAPNGDGPLYAILLPVAGVTMALGVIGALGRDGIRAILSFHIISQVGYMVLGLALGTRQALAAGVFYLIHHIVVKTALFLAAGVVEGGGGGRLGAVRGMAQSRPWLAVAFLVPALALAGLPPLSGFWGKLFLLIACFESGAWLVGGVALAVSLLTLASMLKIWNAVFWGAPPVDNPPPQTLQRGMLAAALVLAAGSVVIGLLVSPLFAHALRIADQVSDPAVYREAILGDERHAP